MIKIFIVLAILVTCSLAAALEWADIEKIVPFSIVAYPDETYLIKMADGRGIKGLEVEDKVLAFYKGNVIGIYAEAIPLEVGQEICLDGAEQYFMYFGDASCPHLQILGARCRAGNAFKVFLYLRLGGKYTIYPLDPNLSQRESLIDSWDQWIYFTLERKRYRLMLRSKRPNRLPFYVGYDFLFETLEGSVWQRLSGKQ